jgi:hypothetical protein
MPVKKKPQHLEQQTSVRDPERGTFWLVSRFQNHDAASKKSREILVSHPLRLPVAAGLRGHAASIHAT